MDFLEVISFTIPYPPTKAGKTAFCRRFGLNAYYAGKPWPVRRRDAGKLHQLVECPVAVRFRWHDGLDVDNHAVMGKAFLDAMKGYILPDDSRKWVRRVSHEFWDGKEILVEVTPYEHEADVLQ